MSLHANISEMFSAIQGEGKYVGERQIFLRFSICDLRCAWCDTPNSLIKNQYFLIETYPGSREFKKIENPININDLLEYVLSFNLNIHSSISLTGGEPLLHSDFLLEFLPELLKKSKIKIHLETAGHRVKELEKIIHLIDYVSMDFKLPSSSNTNNLFNFHRDFLDICIKNKKTTSVKIVITSTTKLDELIYAVNIVSDLSPDKNIEIFLQPVTKINNLISPDEITLLKIHSELITLYPKIKIIPQVHALMGGK